MCVNELGTYAECLGAVAPLIPGEDYGIIGTHLRDPRAEELVVLWNGYADQLFGDMNPDDFGSVWFSIEGEVEDYNLSEGEDGEIKRKSETTWTVADSWLLSLSGIDVYGDN